MSARLLVRRIPELNKTKLAGQDPLFPLFRYHAIFTDNPLGLVAAEAQHRGHAVVEQVIADLKNSALAHLPSGKFTANAAWLVTAAIAFNLTRFGTQYSRASCNSQNNRGLDGIQSGNVTFRLRLAQAAPTLRIWAATSCASSGAEQLLLRLPWRYSQPHSPASRPPRRTLLLSHPQR